LLILLLLRSNPPHLYSNVQYIQRFRSPERLSGEGAYYLNSLEAAVGWIETIEKVQTPHLIIPTLKHLNLKTYLIFTFAFFYAGRPQLFRRRF